MLSRQALLLLLATALVRCSSGTIGDVGSGDPDAAPRLDSTPGDTLLPDRGFEDAEPGPDISLDAGDPQDAGPTCGDGVIETPETCDEGPGNTGTPCVVARGGFECSYCDSSCERQVVTGLGRITGTVVSFNEFDVGIVPGVTVGALSNNRAAVTDELGRFVIEDVEAGERVQLVAFAPASDPEDDVYAIALQEVHVGHGQTTTITPSLLEGCAAVRFAGAETLVLDTELICPEPMFYAYAGVSAPPDALLRFDRTPLQGEVRFELVPVPVEASFEPSWFQGLPSSNEVRRTDSSTVALESLGAMHVLIFYDGSTPAVIAPGRTITLQLSRTPGLKSGDTAPLAYFDILQNAWIERGVATASIAGDREVWVAEADRLGWWTVFEPRTAGGCVTGGIAVEGVAIARTPVTARVIDRAELAEQPTDENGAFCVDLSADRFFKLLASHSPPNDPRRWTTRFPLLAMAPADSSCAGARGSCADVGVIELDPVNPVCQTVELYWLNAGGTREPYSGDVRVEYVFPALTPEMSQAGRRSRAFLGTFRTGVNGALCLQTPEGEIVLSTTESGVSGSPCTLPITTGQANAGICGIDETGCQALGTLDFFCGS